MSLDRKQLELIAELAAVRNGQERLMFVVARGKRAPALASELKCDTYKIEGCLSNLWLVPTFHDGRCFFACDSDSAVVKGAAILLCEFFSGHAPDEILESNAEPLSAAGLSQHINQNRRNGLGRIIERIRAFAAEHAQQ